jgi:hypothetical protein
VEQISPDKDVSCPRTLVRFLSAQLAMPCEPGALPSGAGSPERLGVLWRFCSSARGSCPRLPSDRSSRRRPCLGLVVAGETLAIGSPTGDLHPISSRPCRAYTPPVERAPPVASSLTGSAVTRLHSGASRKR